MWGAIEADFHREYGIDLAVPGLLRSRTWRWFTVRLRSLSPEALTRHQARKTSTPTESGSAMAALAAAAAR